MLLMSVDCRNNIITQSPYKKLKQDRYSSFDSGHGALFESGKMSMEELINYAVTNGEPKQISGKQELYEQIINMYI